VSSDVPNLNAHETRLFGVLVEKSLTTPDNYPLSLNAAVNGSNQKSNRDPVVDYMEAEVHIAFQGLLMKHLAGRVTGASSRTEKYRHNGRETLGLDDRGLAVLAELMMRGPQTAGDLRARANRMSALPTQDDLRAVLDTLIERGYVRSLPPAPGSRAGRFGELLGPGRAEPAGKESAGEESAGEDGDPDPAGASPASSAPGRSSTPPQAGLAARVESLEGEVASLRRDLADLMAQLGVGEPDAE